MATNLAAAKPQKDRWDVLVVPSWAALGGTVTDNDASIFSRKQL